MANQSLLTKLVNPVDAMPASVIPSTWPEPLSKRLTQQDELYATLIEALNDTRRQLYALQQTIGGK